MTVKTTCAYCGTGCGILADKNGQGVTIKGDPEHPANFGRLCSKGSALGDTLGTEGRLLYPQINDRRVNWEEALDLVASKFSDTISTYGPDSVAFYVSGQLLTEDYYVANKLIKGYLGTANIDTNSRLCMASTVAGHKRAFGTDTVPGTYEDLEEADLIILVGSNLAWCHPVLYQRIAAAKAEKPWMKVVNVDPRKTATSDLADLHLQIAPGGDVALFNYLLANTAKHGQQNTGFVNAHVDGYQSALDAAAADDVNLTGLSEQDLADILALWLKTEKTVTVFSQGVNQSSSGTDKVNAIINCHLATGRIGRKGMGPLSVTGQPNAMGGREVGGLANMLACHLDIEDSNHRDAVQSYWRSPTMPKQAGLKAVDMFDAVEDGKIKAIWVMCTNPAQSMPDADRVKSALQNCDFVAVSEMYSNTETAKTADVLLPASGWGEKHGSVTNSDRMISRQRAIAPPPAEARHDWQIISDVAKRMGFADGFDYEHPHDIFIEHAKLSGIAAALGKDFDISGLDSLSRQEYEALGPTRWPFPKSGGKERFFSDGHFYTPNHKAKMLALTHTEPSVPQSAELPFTLNTGRVRDHWHTMTRTGLAAQLNQHTGEPYIEIHAADAELLHLPPASLAEVTSPNGRAIVRVLISDKVAKGSVFMPLHWTEETAALGRVNALIPSHVDPVSGQPESKAAKVCIKKFTAQWFGYAVSLQSFQPTSAYWAKAKIVKGWQAEFADISVPSDWESYATSLFGLGETQIISVTSTDKSSARIALMQNNKLAAVFFASQNPVALSRSFVSSALGGDSPVLAGHAGQGVPDPGTTLCACFNVGINTILNAIQSQELVSVEQVGNALQAGTNCGSCRPEISALLHRNIVLEAAE
ncbi:nitrate reductase [Cognatishimia sp. WU-CL00825]|uniref:nitrate reductase n=1 Tax=Cognatishimia sp. WU-CL00825 TaxID=3127658 RepID=UPI0031035622